MSISGKPTRSGGPPASPTTFISALAVNERLTFNDLKRLLQTTDGNLSVHARKLEDAQYVACEKTFDGRIPRTEYRLTAAGRKQLNAETQGWEQTAAIIGRFFADKAEDLK